MADQHAETVDLREVDVSGRREYVAEHRRPERVNVENDSMESVIGFYHKLGLPIEGLQVRLVGHLELVAFVLSVYVHDFKSDGLGASQHFSQLILDKREDTKAGKSASVTLRDAAGE
jgi:hypothetical protein